MVYEMKFKNYKPVKKGLIVFLLCFVFYSFGETKKEQPALLPKKMTGVRILNVQKGSVFEELGLKKNDMILKINKTPLNNSKHFIRLFRKFRKKNFTLTLLRKSQTLRLSYVVRQDPLSLNYKYKLKNSRLVGKSVVPKDILAEHSHLLQKAFIIQAEGSLVYDRPSFDGKQVHWIPFGEKAVVSKKILKPEREMGTFYKVFLKKPKKIVGYISEVEVVPELIKRKSGRYITNPEYDLWKLKITQGSLKIDDTSDTLFPENEIKKSSSKTHLNRFVGISLGSSFEPAQSFQDRLRFGLKFGVYNLQFLNINMDINVIFNPKWEDVSFDIMGGYVFLQAGKFKAGASAGLKTDIQFEFQDVQTDLIISLSGLLPLTRNLIWRNDVRFSGFFQSQSLSPRFLTALQWGF